MPCSGCGCVLILPERIAYPTDTGPWCEDCADEERQRIRRNLNAWSDAQLDYDPRKTL